MSIELLLFVAFFVVLPLVQMLIKASQRDVLTPKPGQSAPRPRPRPAPRPQPAAQRGEAPGPPRPPSRTTPVPRPAPAPSRPPSRKVPEARPAPVEARPSPLSRPPVMRRRALEPAIEEVLATARRVTTLVPLAAVKKRTPRGGLGSREDLRRAIVLATILGPPRGTSPYDGPGASQAGSRA